MIREIISSLLKMVEDQDEVGWLEDLKEIIIQDEAKDLFDEILG